MLGSFLKMGLVVAVIALIGLALFRPATLFGVDAKGLANSLGSEVRHSKAICVAERAGHWRCVLQGGSLNRVEYAVTTHRFGCWSGSRIAPPGSLVPVDSAVSGCIGLTDLLGN